MSSRPPPAREVFRGMQVDAVPLRVGCRPRAAESAQAAATGEDPLEAALRLAREQGLREGREQGVQSGHAQGLLQGRAAAAEEVRKAVDEAVTQALLPLQAEHRRAKELADAVQSALDGALTAAQDEMIALCYDTICRMVGPVAAQPEAVQTQLAHLLRLHCCSGDVVLHVHPQDAELLERGDAECAVLPRWVADPQVKLGGCILRSKAGGLDARLEAMLDRCKAALLESRARRAAGQAGTGGQE